MQVVDKDSPAYVVCLNGDVIGPMPYGEVAATQRLQRQKEMISDDIKIRKLALSLPTE